MSALFRSRRTGLLRQRTFRILLLAVSLAGPAVFFPNVLRHPRETIPCGLPVPDCRMGDAAIATSVLGRAWNRFDEGKTWNRDDRVFAPYPDTWPLSEGYLLQALLGYPWARLFGSLALGYNVPLFLACVLTAASAGAFFSRLSGRGWAALLAALLWTWGPARLNEFGILSSLWAGLAPLAMVFGLRYLDRGRLRDAALFSAVWVALGLASLYGLLLGALTAGFVLLASGLPRPARGRRLAGLALAGLFAALPLVWVNRSYFRLAESFDVRVSRLTVEGQSADLASVLHHGAFSGPARSLLDPLVPGFPVGAGAFFPTFCALAVVLVSGFVLPGKARPAPPRRRPERSTLPWLCLAALTFAFALGPTVRLLGRPLGPGPWRLLMNLPVFSSLRGVQRWDQWFGFAVAALTAILLGRLLRALRPAHGRLLLAGLAAVAILDLAPRPVTAFRLPPASPVDLALRALDRDAVVGVYPFGRRTSELSWIEQLSHRRRVLNGYQSFPPPIHLWLEEQAVQRPPLETFALYRELGVSAIEVHLDATDESRRRQILDLVSDRPRGWAPKDVRRAGDRVLFLFDPLPPVLVDPARLAGLRFEAQDAIVPGIAGRVSFRLAAGERAVFIEEPGIRLSSTLTIALAGAGGLKARLRESPGPGARVVDARTGALIGVAEGRIRPDPRSSAGTPVPR